MIVKQSHLKKIEDFKARYALDASPENVVTTLHLMHSHLLDRDSALDQSSLGSNDYGIDGWYFDHDSGELFIYQSKLTDSKNLALKGLKDLLTGLHYLEKIIIEKEVGKLPTNKSIYNLYIELSKTSDQIKKIIFTLLSPFDDNDLLDSPEVDETIKEIQESQLYKIYHSRGSKIALEFSQYNFENVIAPSFKKYITSKLTDPIIKLRINSSLEITYIPLYDLVRLYRQRGDILFHKNVRLSLYNYKDAQNRVAHPMENTLRQICEGELSPDIFPFYHVGITLSAARNASDAKSEISLETPYIINGCQTLTISDRFLRGLEEKKKDDLIEKFKQIKVLAKIVIGTSEDELKEITNCNNRQNPIDNWQLFSNDLIHIEIENSLKKYGIFYERQKGKFTSLMRRTEFAKDYPNTNQTFVDVETLGQIIALSKDNYQWIAKPSEIFVNKSNHDSIFTSDIPSYPKDIIMCYNHFKVVKRALKNYLKRQIHDNEATFSLFNKPIVLAHVHRAALLYHYQRHSQQEKFALSLYKKAEGNLVDEYERIYQKFITKTKKFYENENSSREVAGKKLTKFFDGLYIELGIDTDGGPMPFTERTLIWD